MRKAIPLLLLLAGCEQAPQWKGWVYPNANALFVSIEIGRFDSLEQCRASSRKLLERIVTVREGQRIAGDYECGYKCKSDGGLGGLNVCEKTEK